MKLGDKLFLLAETLSSSSKVRHFTKKQKNWATQAVYDEITVEVFPSDRRFIQVFRIINPVQKKIGARLFLMKPGVKLFRLP